MISRLGEGRLVADALEYLRPSLPTYGPEAWCHFCSRRHPRRKHNLELVTRTVTHGNRRGRRRNRPEIVRNVWAHVPPREASRKKTKARQS